MSFIHDVIKIHYVREGYLPDWPPHLIADDEMYDAFLNENGAPSFFYDVYPEPEVLKNEYRALRDRIAEVIQEAKQNRDTVLPNWVYAYMLGSVVSPKSKKADIHDLLVLLNQDNLYDDFTNEIHLNCYNISRELVRRADEVGQVPTVFGDLEVIKYLRLLQADPTKQVT